jgi:type VI protein secretion system component Hcp
MAIDTYIKFGEGTDRGPDGETLPLILGDSDDAQHYWWCELRGCDFELETSERSGKDGAAEPDQGEQPKTELKPITVKKRVDWASAGLFMKCCEAAESSATRADEQKQDKGLINEVRIHVCRQAGEVKFPYLIVMYYDVTITKFSIDLSGPEPTETITFKAGASTYFYQQVHPQTGAPMGQTVSCGPLANYTPPPSAAATAAAEAASAEAAAAAAAAAGAAGNGSGGGGSGTDAALDANFPGLWSGAGFGVLPG